MGTGNLHPRSPCPLHFLIKPQIEKMTQKIAFPAMRCFCMEGNATMKIRYSGNILPFTGR